MRDCEIITACGAIILLGFETVGWITNVRMSNYTKLHQLIQ